MRKRLLVHVAAGFAVAGMVTGAAAQPTPEDLKKKAEMFAKTYQAQLCTDGTKCIVLVKVGPSCAFTVTPMILGFARGFPAAKVTWKIDSSPGVKFTSDGIVFKAAQNELEQLGSQDGGAVFQWKNNNPNREPRARQFDYSIRVLQGTTLCSIDPTIVNDY